MSSTEKSAGSEAALGPSRSHAPTAPRPAAVHGGKPTQQGVPSRRSCQRPTRTPAATATGTSGLSLPTPTAARRSPAPARRSAGRRRLHPRAPRRRPRPAPGRPARARARRGSPAHLAPRSAARLGPSAEDGAAARLPRVTPACRRTGDGLDDRLRYVRVATGPASTRRTSRCTKRFRTGPRSPRAPRWGGSASATGGHGRRDDRHRDARLEPLGTRQRMALPRAPSPAGDGTDVEARRSPCVPKSIAARVLAALIPVVAAGPWASSSGRCSAGRVAVRGGDPDTVLWAGIGAWLDRWPG